MHDARRAARVRLAVGTLPVLVLALGVARLAWPASPSRLDPAAWGESRAGKPVPDYVTGDQCLFCHRKTVGATWSEDRHNLTVRPIEEDSPALAALRRSAARLAAPEVRLVLGGARSQRFLKPAEAYGRADLLSARWIPAHGGKPGTLVDAERPHWDASRFGSSCAGCHATGVNAREQTFSSLSLDCYTCHGVVPAEHTRKPELALLSTTSPGPARVVTSICAQCHVRTGRSRSTGRPFADNFVPGDNLFRDLRVDFSDQALKRLDALDRHILENVRDVAVLGREKLTCLSCHEVHAGSSRKHSLLPRSAYCSSCHTPGGGRSTFRPMANRSPVCGY